MLVPRRPLVLLLAVGAVRCAAPEQADSAPDEGSSWSDGTDGTRGSDGTDGTTGPDALEDQLRAVVASQPVPVLPLEPPAAQDPALVALGAALFYDPLLSGNRDVSCATCHSPTLATSDALWLSVGTGGTGVGTERADGDYPGFVPRHALDLFSRGDPAWRRLFWDGRVELDEDGQLRTPLGDALPEGLSGVLAAQALLPLLDRTEMLGQPGDRDVLGAPNELALLEDDVAVLDGLVTRVEEAAGYVPLLQAAAGDNAVDIALLANALAAYQTQAFSLADTPWDAWLRGDAGALQDDEKLGALVFFGDGACVACHSGPLLSDQQTHVTAVPQLGPGLDGSAPFDLGRAAVTGRDEDRFAFRTTPLRNVALTAPYMHDGAYPDLESAVLHYASLVDNIADMDTSALHPDLVETVQRDPAHLADLEARLSALLLTDDAISVGLSNVRAFLEALTDPAAAELDQLVPESVPSGLPVGGR